MVLGVDVANDSKKMSSYGKISRLVVHRCSGDEEFVLSTAEMLAFGEWGGVKLWFEAASSGECLRSQPDTVVSQPVRSVFVQVDLSALGPHELGGQKVVLTNRDPK